MWVSIAEAQDEKWSPEWRRSPEIGETRRMATRLVSSPRRQRVDSSSLVAQALDRLRDGGHRITLPRRAVLETLAQLEGHPSVEELYEALELRHPNVHRTTVYRTLETLAALGVVTHVHMSHGTTAYHLTSSVAGEGHLHARCLACNRVFDLPGDLLDAVHRRLARESDFELDARHVALSGICRPCRDAAK